MKKLIATLCLVVSTLAVSACDTTGSSSADTSAPYSMDRTASHGSDAASTEVAPAEEVFQKAQKK